MRDATLERYAALARRAHSLLREPEPETLHAPPGAARILAAGVYRLALYVSAMPGAQPPSQAEIDALREAGEATTAADRR